MLAVAMGLADLGATAIVVVMAIAWLLVALVEWIASRESRYPVQTAWPPAPPPAPGPPEWGEHEQTAFIPPAEEENVATDAATPAEPLVLPAPPAEAAPRRRRWLRRAAR
jgi:hypothetical protein